MNEAMYGSAGNTTGGWVCRRCLKQTWSVTWMTDGHGPYCDKCMGEKNEAATTFTLATENSRLRSENEEMRRLLELCYAHFKYHGSGQDEYRARMSITEYDTIRKFLEAHHE